MLSSFRIEESTIQAYLETDYFVTEGTPLVLNVGKINNALSDLHKEYQVDCSAFITACNPCSKQLDEEDNAKRHAKLARELSHLNLKFFNGIGKHPSNEWPGEESYLILGLNLEDAKELGNRLKQNGIIWNDAAALPHLKILKQATP